MAYLFPSSLKTRLGGSFTTADDVVLSEMCQAAEVQIQTFLGFDPTYSGTTTRFFTGDGTSVLNLGNNVASVTNVWENVFGYFGVPTDAFDSESLLTDGIDYALNTEGGRINGLLLRLNGVWLYQFTVPPTRLSFQNSPCLGCVKVTYLMSSPLTYAITTAGYMLAAAMWAARFNGMGTANSASLDGASYSINPFAGGWGTDRPQLISPVAETILQPYKRRAIARM